jgi:hypothetical protein
MTHKLVLVVSDHGKNLVRRICTVRSAARCQAYLRGRKNNNNPPHHHRIDNEKCAPAKLYVAVPVCCAVHLVWNLTLGVHVCLVVAGGSTLRRLDDVDPRRSSAAGLKRV